MSLNSQANPEFSQKNPDTQEVLKYFDSIIENSESTLKDLRNVLLEIANNEDIKSLLLKNSIIMNIDDDEFTKSIIISDIRKNRLKRDFKMIHIKSKKTVGSYCIQETGNIKISYSDPTYKIYEDGKKSLRNLRDLIKSCINTSKQTIETTSKEISDTLK